MKNFPCLLELLRNTEMKRDNKIKMQLFLQDLFKEKTGL